MKSAVFLDRDGVINEQVEFLHEPDKTVILPTVAETISAIHKRGLLVIVVTNQGGVARGFYTEKEAYSVHARLQRLFLEYGSDAVPDAYYCCFHHENYSGKCSCRKPAPGMLLQAANDFNIDLGSSVMIGDRLTDLEAGVNAGCRQVALVTTGYGRKYMAEAAERGFVVAGNLQEAISEIL